LSFQSDRNHISSKGDPFDQKINPSLNWPYCHLLDLATLMS